MKKPAYLTDDVIKRAVVNALNEDLGGDDYAANDITANLIPSETAAKATLITREDMVVCGVDWVNCAFHTVNPDLQLEWQVGDGDFVSANSQLLEISGNARAILTAERTALNFLQTLSATATQTHHYTQLIGHSKTQLLDTRKTLPGMRLAQKYAVLCGGGSNHRIGLFDAFLIKENHIAACGSIAAAVATARSQVTDKRVEVEVESIEELTQAIAAGADIVMLDNFPLHLIHEAVELAQGHCKLEVSGNITDADLQLLATTGVDFISSGALTKSVQAIDLSLRLFMQL
ncbi:carboxylating nicotinate-nucleotide diphosphorylase [Alteromonas sp. ASW11-36]|uniref:nicotinate-nucleotide diphosphorylase (carboxylating) n=1 Tax=Alteromonas arenosi TaxID=3055817 RepID=A0ABT7STN2_9ALTE|nr:carboxylating nicotinate-nucleotide diphosphorylase [Alteromonas sp. ASW11-36]MDM7859548.1 carboxylating nicotinate-nucleotide diphosphorylase [Alteromonas sp. ASW11-36]